MLHVGHAGEHGQHAVGSSCETESPRGHTTLRLALFHLGGYVVRHVGKTSAKEWFHYYGWNSTFFQFSIKIHGIGVARVYLVSVVPVEVVELYLHEVPMVTALVVPL